MLSDFKVVANTLVVCDKNSPSPVQVIPGNLQKYARGVNSHIIGIQELPIFIACNKFLGQVFSLK